MWLGGLRPLDLQHQSQVDLQQNKKSRNWHSCHASLFKPSSVLNVGIHGRVLYIVDLINFEF